MKFDDSEIPLNSSDTDVDKEVSSDEDDKNEMTSDVYLTKYPKYADSNIMNELTNVGYFFDNDENNNFINIKDKILPDNCNLNGD